MPRAADALAGAVGEALDERRQARRTRGACTVFAEPSDDGDAVACSVHDDGRGFEPAKVPEGVGLSRSIRGRMEEAGGRVEIESRPGSGTEVRLWLPCG